MKSRLMRLFAALALVLTVSMIPVMADEIDNPSDDAEYDAAPAVAERLLADAGISPRYGKGRDGGNHISDVAQKMGPGTDFNEVNKTNTFLYEWEIAQFLNNNEAEVAFPKSVLESVLFIPKDDGGTMLGSAIGDKLVFTFSYDIELGDGPQYIDFQSSQEIKAVWNAVSWNAEGNVLTMSTTRTFGNPRSITRDVVTVLTGVFDLAGESVVIPAGGVTID
ncbi:hypothetical protein Dehly_0965 [Dehalogenimonas lykanthroporepellens BL-DC-9]|nr:hypothetical protein Dehly_0965 [Dehalogenimonas lykanthroporepellens BL-DC-9]